MTTSGVVLVGDTVRRPAKKNSVFVHDVLRHLELRGLPQQLGQPTSRENSMET